MIAEWSAVIAAFAFVVLAGGVLAAIRIALVRLAHIEQAAAQLQQDMRKLAAQAGGLMESTEATIRIAQRQLESSARLFEAAGQIGGAIQHTTSAVERTAAVLSEAAEQHAERAETKRRAGEALEWAELGMAAWQLWQSGRRNSSFTSSQDEEEPIKNEGRE